MSEPPLRDCIHDSELPVIYIENVGSSVGNDIGNSISTDIGIEHVKVMVTSDIPPQLYRCLICMSCTLTWLVQRCEMIDKR